MWIKTQSGREIINTDNIIGICVDNDEATGKYSLLASTNTSTCFSEIGLYNTDRRATDVLNSIYELTTADGNYAYTLPEE